MAWGCVMVAVCRPFQGVAITRLSRLIWFRSLQQQEQDEALRTKPAGHYIASHRYMGLIRNFIRLTPLVMFPGRCQSGSLPVLYDRS